jgi:hypothetical protein
MGDTPHHRYRRTGVYLDRSRYARVKACRMRGVVVKETVDMVAPLTLNVVALGSIAPSSRGQDAHCRQAQAQARAGLLRVARLRLHGVRPCPDALGASVRPCASQKTVMVALRAYGIMLCRLGSVAPAAAEERS